MDPYQTGPSQASMLGKCAGRMRAMPEHPRSMCRSAHVGAGTWHRPVLPGRGTFPPSPERLVSPPEFVLKRAAKWQLWVKLRRTAGNSGKTSGKLPNEYLPAQIDINTFKGMPETSILQA